MIAAILDHLWQSTLLAVAIGVLAVVFRKARASVRYGLWLTASVKFLLPFAALATLGRLLGPAIRPPAEVAPDAVFIARAAEPFSIPTQSDASLDPMLLLLAVWALGVASVLIVWTVRGMRIRPMLRQATPVALAAPMRVMSTPMMMEPGLVGLWRPVLLVPETLFDHLDRAGIEALVAHEACHYRRRDNLTGAIHMLVEALFWFHPMVWWIGGRLVDERERACDEAVVGSGHDPAVYARGLLECCRLFLQSPLRCVAGASGSNLSRRVEMIMTSLPRPKLSRPAKAALVAAGVCALASPVAAGWLTTPTVRQAVREVAAIASSPATTFVHQPSAATTAPGEAALAGTFAPHLAIVAPGASGRRIATLQQQPIQLASNQDRPQPLIASGLASVSTAEIPDAKLLPVADSGAAKSAGGRRGVVCMQAKSDRPVPGEPAVKTLCMTRSEWRKAAVEPRDCWATRYGCAPEGDGYSGSSFSELGLGSFVNTNAAGQTGSPAPTYTSGGYGPQH